MKEGPSPSIFVLKDDGRKNRVRSLQDFAWVSPASDAMKSELMRPKERRNCRWIGFGVTKGVTSAPSNMTLISISRHGSGVHGRLINGLRDTDPSPRCYDLDHDKGFGDFIRWVHFSDPTSKNHVLGIDFCLSCRRTAGVATTVLTILDTVGTLLCHGLPGQTEIVLLNARMCEEPGIEAMRRDAKLLSAGNWDAFGSNLFGASGSRCPRCGLPTITGGVKFCCRCGANPDIVRANHKRGG